MSVAGVAYAFADSVVVLVLVALTGTLSTDANESGPLTSLEQAMMGGAAPEIRARVFGRYNAIAYLAGAVGALAGGGPALLRERSRTSQPTSAGCWCSRSRESCASRSPAGSRPRSTAGPDA